MGKINTINDFWSKIKKTKTCWLWVGRHTKAGYGQFQMNKIRKYAHHFSYLLTKKLPLDTKLFLCHTCDIPNCVNPQHLFEGNNTLNMQDMMRKGRGRGQFTKDTPTIFKKGNIPASRKLTENTAYKIKLDLQTMRQCDVIRKYSVSRDTVRGIVRGDTWAWLCVD